eukprot:CAMPEP_0117448228 /NCGR_PEP_ID=MMETSP0759-20121206/7290_1 /TAXON_ID=63605 /ORGANISM="Percolomonas cosmopolitus, Strain WS" /LENGTH=149 /DNA_ID=CAMNT_0005240603 /DNA_START=32 /DNA_END=481 /DNA_ORIENTATION=+
MERTFVAIKPDAVQRGLVGEILARYEKKGIKIAAAKFFTPTKEIAQKHYEEHSQRPFFAGLVEFITSGPVLALVLEGKNVIKTVRNVNGATNPVDATPGTIRGDLCMEVGRNIVHASDALETAQREIALWFKDEEIVSYKQTAETHVYE